MKKTTTRAAATASLGLIGVSLLSGCGSAVEATEPPETSDAPAVAVPAASSEPSASTESTTSETASAYADGTYTSTGQYVTPGGVERVEITLDVAGDKITGVQFVGDPQRPESENFQGQFADGIAAEVVGKGLDEVQVDRIAGSSLTSGGFNQALEAIKEEAAAK